MYEMILRLKSGREFKFKCDEYRIEIHNMTGSLIEFQCKNVIGENLSFSEHRMWMPLF